MVVVRSAQASRRHFLFSVSSGVIAAAAVKRLAVSSNAANSAALDGPQLRGLEEKDGQSAAAFENLGDGLLVQDIASPPRADDNLQVGPNSSVTVKYVLRRSNGYLIYASYGGVVGSDDDFVFRMGKGQAVPGFEKALLGLAAGSRRRFVLPPHLGYARGGTKVGKSPGPLPPDWGSRRSLESHSKEPLLFEVLVSRVR